MPTWVCDVVGVKPNGCLSWRRNGASEPRGAIPHLLVPSGLRVGQQVVLKVARQWTGAWEVTECRILDVAGESREELGQRETSTESRHSCGQVRWVSVRNPIENPMSAGKLRPALLVNDLGEAWRVMGLTRKTKYDSGQQRTAIPNHLAVDLACPGYLWGDRLTRVDSTDVGALIGAADQQLIDEVVRLAMPNMGPNELRNLSEYRRTACPSAAFPTRADDTGRADAQRLRI